MLCHRKVFIVYDLITGNTEKVAKLIAPGVREAGSKVQVKRVENVEVYELTEANAIILGSPTHYGSMSPG
jgi:menaquinone-dependent protoporphyrinogen IX oxidase